MVIHQDMANGRWYSMNICEQLGNVGSEVGRAINWEKKGNIVQKENALERALDLLDLTLDDNRWHEFPGRVKEISLARALVADVFYGKNEFNSDKDSLEKYFNQFAMAARRNC